jgi:hypothetical protein
LTFTNLLGCSIITAVDCDSDHYLVVAKIRKRLAVNKQISQVSYGEAQCEKLNKVELIRQYHVKISNRYAALEELDAEVDIKSPWETIR